MQSLQGRAVIIVTAHVDCRLTVITVLHAVLCMVAPLQGARALVLVVTVKKWGETQEWGKGFHSTWQMLLLQTSNGSHVGGNGPQHNK